MTTVYVKYLSQRYRELLNEGWAHWCHYVTDDGDAMLVRR